MDQIRRRNRVDLMYPVELAMFKAMQELEKIGADVKLTKAGDLLKQASDIISDFLEENSNDE